MIYKFINNYFNVFFRINTLLILFCRKRLLNINSLYNFGPLKILYFLIYLISYVVEYIYFLVYLT